MEPLGLQYLPPSPLPAPCPSWPDVRQHPAPSGACQQLPQEVFIGPQGPNSASLWGPPRNPSEREVSVLGKVHLFQKIKGWGIGEGNVLPPPHFLSPQVLGGSWCSGSSPARTSGSCLAGCGVKCCISTAVASILGSRGPAPPASWGGATFISNSLTESRQELGCRAAPQGFRAPGTHSAYSESGFRMTSMPSL